MLQSKRERFLALVVFLAVLSFVATFLYRQMGDTVFGMDDLINEKIISINSLLENQKKAVEINSRYEEMKTELTLEGSNPEQDAEIRRIMTDLLKQVGLTNQYGSISQKEQRMEDDFKLASLSITQIRCTPQQLGQLLFRIEKESEVMDVMDCRIDNMITDIGKYQRGQSRNQQEKVSPSGMLEVDLQVSRLIDYRKGEKPKKGR